MFRHKDLKLLGHKLNKYMSNFHPVFVVGRGSEPQRKVGEN